MIWLVIAGVAVGMVGAGIIAGPPNARLHDGSTMADPQLRSGDSWQQVCATCCKTCNGADA